MPLEPGTRLGPYEILELAGAGGMGEVYRARDTRLRRTVAIKVASAAVNALFDLAEHRFIVFLAYVAARNPRTRFIVYSRTVFQTHGGEDQWVAAQVARLPVLTGRLNAFIVPGGREQASFREPQTAQLLRTRVAEVLGHARR